MASVRIGRSIGVMDKIVVGDVYGGINFVSLSTMEVIDRYVVGTSKVRSLCASSISGESILVGCENGGVFMVGVMYRTESEFV